MHLKRRKSWPPYVSALDALSDECGRDTSSGKSPFKCIGYKTKTNNKYYEILTINECVEK